MPGVTEPTAMTATATAATANTLLFTTSASLYSSQGLLSGKLSLFHDRLVWNEVSSKYTDILSRHYPEALRLTNCFV